MKRKKKKWQAGGCPALRQLDHRPRGRSKRFSYRRTMSQHSYMGTFLCITKGLPTKPIEKKLGRPFLYKGRLGSFFFFFFLKSMYIYVIFTITQIIMYLGRELTVVKPDYQSVHIQIFLAGRSIGEDWTTDKH